MMPLRRNVSTMGYEAEVALSSSSKALEALRFGPHEVESVGRGETCGISIYSSSYGCTWLTSGSLSRLSSTKFEGGFTE